jgi:hypothetical protein
LICDKKTTEIYGGQNAANPNQAAIIPAASTGGPTGKVNQCPAEIFYRRTSNTLNITIAPKTNSRGIIATLRTRSTARDKVTVPALPEDSTAAPANSFATNRAIRTRVARRPNPATIVVLAVVVTVVVVVVTVVTVAIIV